MNIVTEPKLSGKPIADKPHKRPVRLVRWFIIVGLLLSLLVGGLVYFNYFRGKMIAQFFANNKPPPASVSVAAANSETIPNLLTAVGDLAAVHQVNVTSDVNGRITDILFTAGASVKEGTPLLQMFDGPEQGDLANFKAQQRVAQISLDRAKQLAERQVGPQATWIPRRRRSTRPAPASPRPRRSSRRSWCGRRSTANSAFARSRSDNI